MKYVFEIRVQTSTGLSVLEAALEIMVNLLQLLGVTVTLAGVAQETEAFSLGDPDPEHAG